MNKAFLIKNGNSWLVKIHMSVISQTPVDLEFSSEGKTTEVVSTSHGFIKSGIITLPRGCKSLEVVLEYTENMQSIDCDLVYRSQDGGSQESLSFTIPDTMTLTKFAPEIGVASKKKSDIIYSPEWELKIVVKGDIHILVSGTGQPTFFAFGDMSNERSESDFVFPAIPGQSGWMIPKEVIWTKEKDYKGEHVACFELVKLDHQNILYKIPVSNKLRIDGFPKKDRINISQFRDPLGLGLDPSRWSISQESNLPVYAL